MTTKKSEELIVKFITNQANQEEIELLSQWLEDVDNQKVFQGFVKTNYAIDYIMDTFDQNETKKLLFQKIKEEKSVFYKRRIPSYFKYAAVIMATIGIAYFYQNNNSSQQNDSLLIPKDEAITLVLDNGKIQTINPSNSINVYDKAGKIIGRQSKSKIIYAGNMASNTLVYNTIKIPYGKRFEVALSDGTIVHLNSGTSLRYPVQFLKNQSRNVFLTGEAFFEVAKDKAHPFTVNTSEMNVEVLGTKFNVNSYKEEGTSDVVLVEGKVALYKDQKTAQNPTFLTPGLKGTIVKGEQNFTKEEVNTDNYTGWIQGSLVFKKKSFNSIIRTLERNYNVTFINKDKALGKEIFNARFDNEPIEVVLKYLSDSYAINYTIKDNMVIIE
jgi:transmembrane sensor